MNNIETFSDAELVMQSLAGNREAFGGIVARYQTLICSLAYSGTGSLTQSEDLAQETFVAAWRQLGSLREPEKLRSWLCGIARNLTCGALRKQGREPSHAAEELDAAHESAATEPMPMEQAISNEEQAILWRSLERIPEIYREPIVLFYREHQSIEAVAHNLELTEDAVKQRLSRGRKLLQEQVLAFVEGALQRTSPGKSFTLSVLAALPAMGVSTKAAALGATAAKGSAAAKAAAASGIFAAIFGPFLVLFGNYVGYRMSLDAAGTDEERRHIKLAYKKFLGMSIVLFIALGGFIAWSCRYQKDHELVFTLLITMLMVVFPLTIFIFVIGTFKQRRRFLAGLREKNKASDSAAPAWEYRSRLHLFGQPLVNIRIGDRFALLKKPVAGWIAIGDHAVGGLFAFGGLAIAPLSIGAMAIGLLPFGGLAVGILALGGFGIGVWTYGGMVMGWQALGGCALAWNGAGGGIALAHDFALGGVAQAAQANTKIAQQFIDSSWFFHYGQMMLNYSVWLNLLWVVPMMIQWRIIARKNRAAQPAHS